MKKVYVIECFDNSKTIPEIIGLLPCFFESKEDAVRQCKGNQSVVELYLYEEEK